MRIVIKIGTSTLTHQNGKVNLRRIEEICKIISDIMNSGNEVILGRYRYGHSKAQAC